MPSAATRALPSAAARALPSAATRALPCSAVEYPWEADTCQVEAAASSCQATGTPLATRIVTDLVADTWAAGTAGMAGSWARS